jgi:hypothetical protein
MPLFPGSAWEHKDRRLCLRAAVKDPISCSSTANHLGDRWWCYEAEPRDIAFPGSAWEHKDRRLCLCAAVKDPISCSSTANHLGDRWWCYEAEPRDIAFPGRAWERGAQGLRCIRISPERVPEDRSVGIEQQPKKSRAQP